MNILVTGGAGLVGSNLVNLLQDQSVIVVDNLSTGSVKNIPNGIFYSMDILDNGLEYIFEQEKIDIVYHLASQVGHVRSINQPIDSVKNNIEGTVKLLELSRKYNIKRFIYASADSILDSSMYQSSPYSIDKLTGEMYCNFYHEYYNLPIVKCRFANIYGKGEVLVESSETPDYEIKYPFRQFIPNIIYWIKNNIPIPVFGSGNQSRDYLYAGDLADGLEKCINVDKNDLDIEFGTGIETRVVNLIDIISKQLGIEPKINCLSDRRWDKQKFRKSDISKAKEILNWYPKTSLEEGIKQTSEWITEVYF